MTGGVQGVLGAPPAQGADSPAEGHAAKRRSRGGDEAGEGPMDSRGLAALLKKELDVIDEQLGAGLRGLKARLQDAAAAAGEGFREVRQELEREISERQEWQEAFQKRWARLLGPLASGPGHPAAAAGSPEAAARPATELLVLPNCSFARPSGRFDLLLTTRGLSLRSRGGVSHGPLPWSSVTHLLKLPKPEPHRKAGVPAKAHFVVFVLSSHLTVGKQVLQCVAMNVDGIKPMSADALARISSAAENEIPEQEHSATASFFSAARCVAPDEAEHAVVARLLAAGSGMRIHEPEPEVCPLESIKAYRGVDDGALYVMRVGLCFLPKPGLFIAAADISGIACSRRSSCTADIVVQRAGGGKEVFSNVAQDDVVLLNQFVGMLLAARNGAGTLGEASAQRGAGSDDEEEDEDFEPDCDANDAPSALGSADMPAVSLAHASAATPAQPGQRKRAAFAEDAVAKRTRSSMAASAAVQEELPSEDELFQEESESDGEQSESDS